MLTKLNFHHLELFYRVVQSRNFSRAAEELYISQPAISTQIRDFEASLGVKLFDRSARELLLTQAGELVYAYAQQIFTLTQQIEQGVANLKGLKTGNLSIAASSTIGEYLLPRLIGHFKNSYPGIKLQLQIYNTTGVVERILARQIDLGFVGDEVNNQAALLEIKPFYQDEIVLFIGTDHPLLAKARTASSSHTLEFTVAELMEAKVELVMREQGSATRRCAERSLREAGLNLAVAMDLGSNEAVKQATVAGLGAGMLSSRSLEAELKAGMVKIVTVPGLRCLRYFHLIHRKDKGLTQAEERFLELIMTV